MTAARHHNRVSPGIAAPCPSIEQGSGKRSAGRAAAAILALVLAVGMLAPAIAGLATTERVVLDWRTGLAIDGFDPVAYFIDGAPVVGKADHEYVFAGATWRFRNAGNQAAFAKRPDVYMPRFGGYDPIHVAQGVAVAGNPDLWLVVGNRLFLFYDPESLAAFRADPARLNAAAERRWPALLQTLAP